jgi:hypothetical protein
VAHASPTTTEALARIGALYGIEEADPRKARELRCSVRQARARPLLDELRQWMEKTLRSLSTKSETASAIRYALSHWRALTRYVDDGFWKSTTTRPKGRCVPWRWSVHCAPPSEVLINIGKLAVGIDSTRAMFACNSGSNGLTVDDRWLGSGTGRRVRPAEQAEFVR